MIGSLRISMSLTPMESGKRLHFLLAACVLLFAQGMLLHGLDHMASPDSIADCEICLHSAAANAVTPGVTSHLPTPYLHFELQLSPAVRLPAGFRFSAHPRGPPSRFLS
jgi:hypothetical protein